MDFDFFVRVGVALVVTFGMTTATILSNLNRAIQFHVIVGLIGVSLFYLVLRVLRQEERMKEEYERTKKRCSFLERCHRSLKQSIPRQIPNGEGSQNSSERASRIDELTKMRKACEEIGRLVDQGKECIDNL